MKKFRSLLIVRIVRALFLVYGEAMWGMIKAPFVRIGPFLAEHSVGAALFLMIFFIWVGAQGPERHHVEEPVKSSVCLYLNSGGYYEETSCPSDK